MWELLARVVVEQLIALIVLVVLLPVLFVVATPFILLRAATLAWRGRQRCRYAIEDGYSSIWNLSCELMRRL
ncbi:MAG: hypothetical protein DLM52_06750 [Chthoniobacterales bacterium]|nr:MAG: hypothetical protein DLM52_06750 [Chthoniobacterales bacterium]